MTRSTPGISSSGKPIPQSIIIISLPYSSKVIFFPISLSPPRGMTRSLLFSFLGINSPFLFFSMLWLSKVRTPKKPYRSETFWTAPSNLITKILNNKRAKFGPFENATPLPAPSTRPLSNFNLITLYHTTRTVSSVYLRH